MIREMTKALARRVPAIDALVRNRDDLLRQVASLQTERDMLRAQVQSGLNGAGNGPILPVSRTDKILSPVHRSMRILEIGASYNPIAPKAAGWNSFTLDHATQDELRKKYASLGDQAANIEPVDFVWRGGPIEGAIPEKMHGSFDACITSHVIEHIPDPISLFRSLDRLLSPNGVASFAVPDKRYCFDFFRPLTMAPAWIEAFERKATRHSRRLIFENTAYFMHNGDSIAWGPEAPKPVSPRILGDLDSAKATADASLPNEPSEYVDAHAWCFTPSSFELLFLELGALGLVDFWIERTFQTAGCEFFVILRKGRLSLSKQQIQDKRQALLCNMIDEVAKQSVDITATVAG